MSNKTVCARLDFSSEDETYELDPVIDLGECLSGEAPVFHQWLAKAAGIDPCSCLYDALESYEIAFPDATGVAVRSCFDDQFDWVQFEQDREAERDWEMVMAIAERSLPARNLDVEPDLKAALLAVYRAGKASDAKGLGG